MDSLYQGLSDTTYVHPEYKIYGKDILQTATKEELFREMKMMLGIDKCVTKPHMVTNIINIYEQIKGVHQFDITHDEFQRLECCLRIKYPDRVRPSPAMENIEDILPIKKRHWCVIS